MKISEKLFVSIVLYLMENNYVQILRKGQRISWESDRDYCILDLPKDVYKPIQSDKAWISARVTCGKFR